MKIQIIKPDEIQEWEYSDDPTPVWRAIYDRLRSTTLSISISDTLQLNVPLPRAMCMSLADDIEKSLSEIHSD